MTIEFDSNKIPSREEREERVLDLHFNQNKNYRQIAKEMKMSLRDIGEIVNRAKQEKERQEHKCLFVQAYEQFSKGKTPLEVAIILNIGEAQVSQYYAEYLKLVQLNGITQIYRELKGNTWYFVNLCKAAKAAKMEAFVNNYRNNDQEYIKLKKSIEDKIRDSLSAKKRFLELAIFSVIESMRSKPDKYSSLVYHNNENTLSSSSKDNSNITRQLLLPPPPYDSYMIEHYKSTLLEESEKLYNDLVDQLMCEVINEGVTEQSVPTPLSLPELPFEGDDKKEYNG